MKNNVPRTVWFNSSINIANESLVQRQVDLNGGEQVKIMDVSTCGHGQVLSLLAQQKNDTVLIQAR